MGTQDLPPSSHDSSCSICAFVSGTSGTLIYEDELWVLGQLAELEAPGWLVLALRRHALGLTGATLEEAEAMGPLLRRVALAIESATDAERVYVLAYGENAAHWHLLLVPRGAEVPVEQRHSEIWGHRLSFVDPDRAREVGELVRDLLTSDASAKV